MPRPPIPPARRTALRRRLLAWWDAGHRDLPWRFPEGAADPYRVWLSEVMLQQTRVEAVVPYYRRFVEAWPTLPALAAARDEEVFAAWSGLGYYARCRNLLAAARTALAQHGGLPASREALRALPGFGPYTAGAVASIAFGIPAAAVDGNVARVLARLFAVRGDPSGRARRRVWALAGDLAGEGRPPARPGDFTQALIELGARVCGRVAACARCPLGALCEARRRGLEGEIPPPRRRAAPRAMTLACAVVERRGRLLLERRPPGGLFAGLLALPSAVVVAGATPEETLASALRAAGLRVRVGADLGAVERELTHRSLRLVAYACTAAGTTSTGPTGRWRWVAGDELAGAGLPTAMRALLDNLDAPVPAHGRSTIDEKSTGRARLLSQGGVEKGPSRGRSARTSRRDTGIHERP